ncbi:MAG TPA: wax ester/triacylglycerol synthase family O-acyltransferase [Solirubrobacteraceae bacterium]|nr:wax ester/triacylglycerol synthase family O-acyltransferase [Solirubrobacteraceae bacterium]
MHDPQRLSPADAGLLALEQRRRMPLHAGVVALFDGDAPALGELLERVRTRLALVPRYRRSVVTVPFGQGRPRWAEDPAFSLEHHVRATALPGGAGENELMALASHLLERPLERARPLWELWLVESLAGGRFALIAKTHAALIDGDGNRDLLAVLFDGGGAPAVPGRSPGPPPPALALLLEALAERATSPREAFESARLLGGRAREELRWRELDLLERLGAPPASRLNTRSGSHRRFAFLDAGLKGARRAKERLGGTLNDVILTAVAGALGRYLDEHGEDTDGLLLRALVPLADAGSGRLLASYAPLPVGIEDPRRRHAEISRALDGLRASGRARAASELLDAEGLAAASVLARAARLTASHHAFNVAIANVPGPQTPLRLLGHELRAVYPALPLVRNQALSIAVVSYAGRLCFGLLADYDAVGDLERLAALLKESLRELPKAPLKRPR